MQSPGPEFNGYYQEEQVMIEEKRNDVEKNDDQNDKSKSSSSSKSDSDHKSKSNSGHHDHNDADN